MSTKNRNGKPTAFQLNEIAKLIRGRNDVKAPKTYKDAENMLKRLRNAAKKKCTCEHKCGTESCMKEQNKAYTVKGNIKSHKNITETNNDICRKGNGDTTVKVKVSKLPIVQNSDGSFTVKLPNDAKEKALVVSAMNDVNEMIDCFNVTMDKMMTSMTKMFSTLF